jgi:hypothetical protein
LKGKSRTEHRRLRRTSTARNLSGVVILSRCHRRSSSRRIKAVVLHRSRGRRTWITRCRRNSRNEKSRMAERRSTTVFYPSSWGTGKFSFGFLANRSTLGVSQVSRFSFHSLNVYRLCQRRLSRGIYELRSCHLKVVVVYDLYTSKPRVF